MFVLTITMKYILIFVIKTDLILSQIMLKKSQILNKKDYFILLICVLDTPFPKYDYHYFYILKKNTRYIHIK